VAYRLAADAPKRSTGIAEMFPDEYYRFITRGPNSSG